jgi:hypothetical protein
MHSLLNRSIRCCLAARIPCVPVAPMAPCPHAHVHRQTVSYRTVICTVARRDCICTTVHSRTERTSFLFFSYAAWRAWKDSGFGIPEPPFLLSFARAQSFAALPALAALVPCCACASLVILPLGDRHSWLQKREQYKTKKRKQQKKYSHDDVPCVLAARLGRVRQRLRRTDSGTSHPSSFIRFTLILQCCTSRCAYIFVETRHLFWCLCFLSPSIPCFSCFIRASKQFKLT